jgi:hypothetical protein
VSQSDSQPVEFDVPHCKQVGRGKDNVAVMIPGLKPRKRREAMPLRALIAREKFKSTDCRPGDSRGGADRPDHLQVAGITSELATRNYADPPDEPKEVPD